MRLKWLLVMAVAALALAAPAMADQTYTDATGEDANSADISTVAVSNNPTAGTITFVVTITNMPSWEPNSEIDILVDSDQNSSTGFHGFDYLFGSDSTGWYFAQWNGSQFVSVPSVTDLQVTYTNGVLTITMNAADITNPKVFNFAVVTFRGPDPNNPAVDGAPDTGVWTYTMVQPPPPPPPPPPTVDSVSAHFHGVPTHGHAFAITGLEVDLSNGTVTKATALKCTATLGGKPLHGTGTGGCTFHLPSTAKGKQLRIKVTGKYKATALSKTYSFKVK